MTTGLRHRGSAAAASHCAAAPDPALSPALAGAPYACFLDNADPRACYGWQPLIGVAPSLVLRAKGRTVEIESPEGTTRRQEDVFDTLRAILRERAGRPGAAVGYLGYDLGRLIERLPAMAEDDLAVPDCCLAFYDAVATRDRQTRTWRIEGEARSASKLARALQQDAPAGPAPQPPPAAELRRDLTRQAYLAAVQQAKDYIAAGDIIQVNLSQRFAAPWARDPFGLYQRLQALNPAPFAAFLRFPGMAVLSSSPELFLRVRGRAVTTRPIKGTRPRGRDATGDARLKEELLASEKDRAELLMITDLERNDLGRVCEYGSVRVPQLRTVETYATVHHLVATVEGTLRPDADVVDLLRATFPGGSITGAPKIRAMEIIEELEPTRRGVYTGAIGRIGFNGDLDLNIAIRTMVAKDGWAYFQVGGGIVADSDPAAEYQETLDKGLALASALGATWHDTCRG